MGVDSEYYEGVAAPGSVEYFGLLFCPKPEREHFRLLLAFESLVSELSIRRMEQDVRNVKLGWWADEMSRLARRAPVHPVAIAVSNILEDRDISPAPLLELFSAVAGEATGELPASPDKLLDHLASRGAVLPLIADLLMPAGAVLSEASRLACKQAAGGRSLLLLFDSDHHQHRVPEAAENPGTMTPGGLEQQLVRAQIATLRAALSDMPDAERRPLLPLMVMGKLILDRLKANETGERAARSNTLRSLFSAWSAARRTTSGKPPF